MTRRPPPQCRCPPSLPLDSRRSFLPRCCSEAAAALQATNSSRRRPTRITGVARAHQLPVQGIDVAKYQGDIDWNARAQRRHPLRLHEGLRGRRPRRQPLLRQLGGRGRAPASPRGAYHFMYWCRTASEQAVWFTQAVPQDPNAAAAGSRPRMEQRTRRPARGACRARRRSPRSDKMLEIMEYHTGKRPVIYTDINFHRDVLEGELHGLRVLAAQRRRRAARALRQPAVDLLAVHRDRPRRRASRATSTATPSTARRRTGSAGCERGA